MKNLVLNIFRVLSYVISPKLNFVSKVSTLFYTGYMSRLFKSFGSDSYIHRPFTWHDLHNVEVGNNVSIGAGTTLTSWKLTSVSEGGRIVIGDNVSIGEDAHITATTLIHIGKNVC